MVTLSEVLEHAGYNVTTNPDDAKWLVSRVDEFEELIIKAEDLTEE